MVKGKVEKGYASLKLYPFFSLHASVLTVQSSKVVPILIDYMVEHLGGMEIFISVRVDGRYKIYVRCYKEKFKKKIAEGQGDKISISSEEEINVFLDHFELFIKRYLEEILRNYVNELPENCAKKIREVAYSIQ